MTTTARPHALIVDDNPDNRLVIRIALESRNFVVEDIGDPIHAQDVLNTRTFDLLILDLQMPGRTGREILLTLRPNPLHDHMKVIILTAHAYLNTDEIENKADFTLQKPFNPVELAALCDRIQASSAPNITAHTG